MIRKIFARFKRTVLMRIYSIGEIYLLEHRNNTNQQSSAEIKRVTEDNLNDALYFQSQSQLNSFRKFRNEGFSGYYAYLDGKCVHRSWVVPGPAQVRLHKFLPFQIQANEFFIEFCETAPSARGKNIFSHVLSHIASEREGRKILIAVDKGNNASLRSMTKAGFVMIRHERIKVIFGRVIITSLPLS